MPPWRMLPAVPDQPPIKAPSPTPVEETLAQLARDHATEAVHACGLVGKLRAAPAGVPSTRWHREHLRLVREQRLGVYQHLGTMEMVIDANGTLIEFDAPGHEPKEPGMRASLQEATEAVARLAGLPATTPLLRGEVIYMGTLRCYRVFTEPVRPREADDGQANSSPHEVIEASVNAVTGHVYRFRREPKRRRKT